MTTPTARHAARPAAPWPGLLLLEQRRAASLTSTRVILFGCVVWSALSAAG